VRLKRAHVLALRARVRLALGQARQAVEDADAALAALGPRQTDEGYFELETRLSAQVQAARAALATLDGRAACAHLAGARVLAAHLERMLGESERPPDALVQVRTLSPRCAAGA
jgi:hypothetical protein